MSAFQLPAEHFDFARHPAGVASLDALRTDRVDQGDLRVIAAICKQQAVRDWVINLRFDENHVYTTKDAQEFAAFAEQGWHEQTHFVYVVRGEAGKIVGAIDLKSTDADGTEIGYWSDTTEGEGGYMTNGLIALCGLAQQVGYKRVYAHVAIDNKRSSAVLARAGFIGPYKHEPKDPRSSMPGYAYYQKFLDS